MKNNTKHVLWTNENIDLKDWQDVLDEHPELTTDYEKYLYVSAVNDDYLEDEAENLDIELGREIIAIGDLGLWNGRRRGYKYVGTNIRDCLKTTCGEYVTWYVDGLGDLRCDDTHHDGTNHYTFRVFRPGMDFWQKDALLDKIIRGQATRRDINRYTQRLGDHIADIYGFKIRKLPTRLAAAG